MKYGVIIDGLNTYTVLNMCLTSDLRIPAPAQKRTTVDIPGADGDLDLSLALNPYPVFKTRQLSWSLVCTGNQKEFYIAMHELMKYHGKRVDVILPDDPVHHWTGILSVDPSRSWMAQTIQMTLLAQPYALKNQLTVKNIVIDGDTIELLNELKPCVPSFRLITSAGVAHVNGHLIEPDIVNTFEDIILYPGSNVLSVDGTGVEIEVSYQEGTL